MSCSWQQMAGIEILERDAEAAGDESGATVGGYTSFEIGLIGK